VDINDFVGTWTLVGLRVTDADGKVSVQSGDGIAGRIMYAADGNLAMATRHANGAYFVYFGRFEVGDDHVIHHIELSPNADLIGTAQRRLVSFRDGRLMLTASPSIAGGPGSTAEITWQRA